MLFLWATLIHFFLENEGLWLSKNSISVKKYMTVFTNNFLIQTLLTNALSFLYLHIRFRTFRKAIRLNSNANYIITNIPASFYLSQMKRTSDSHYFLHLCANPTNCTISMWMTSIFCFLFDTLVRISSENHN